MPGVLRWHSRGAGSLLASTSHCRSVPRTVWHRRAPIVIGALCALLLLGCSIDGEAQSAPAGSRSRHAWSVRTVSRAVHPRAGAGGHLRDRRCRRTGGDR